MVRLLVKLGADVYAEGPNGIIYDAIFEASGSRSNKHDLLLALVKLGARKHIKAVCILATTLLVMLGITSHDIASHDIILLALTNVANM